VAATGEAFVRRVLTIVGVLAMLLGTIWVTQGTGVVPFGSIANDIKWAYLGAALFVVALFLIAHVRQR
jgi:formate hydrogenlyase subunit 3/multisubunit Na+/H+ antiporter MnhD subunit